MSETLFDTFTVNCFFQRWCNYKVTGIDPQANHDEMEAHYGAQHYPTHLEIVAPGTSRPQPQRIKRTEDWKPSKGAVWVGPRSKFYNPFAAKIKRGESGQATMTRQYLVNDFRHWLTLPLVRRMTVNGWADVAPGNWQEFLGVPFAGRQPILDALPGMRGKDIVCWCSTSQPCHADVLLELANRSES